MILTFDTSMDSAFVSLISEGSIVEVLHNDQVQNHAVFLHKAIHDLLAQQHVNITDVDAIAVTTGPGSYTGIRIGIAAAKGLAFSHSIPLIGVGTLELMAHEMYDESGEFDFYFPLIDARRMEVYTAVYNAKLMEKIPAHNLILEEKSFDEFLGEGKVLFAGSGAEKFSKICSHANASFKEMGALEGAMARLANEKFLAKHFTDSLHLEATYVKEFYNK